MTIRGMQPRRIARPHVWGLWHKPPPTPDAQKGRVPLKNVAIDVEIVDFLAEVRMAQTFVNEGDQPLEVEYQFPLDPAAAVNGFEVTFSDGRTVRGKVQGKEEARDTYDDAVAAGGGGYLLEQNEREPDMFSCSLGNMAPGMEATVVIRLVSQLQVADGTSEGESPGALSFLLLTGVFPRYDPARRDSQQQDQGAEAAGAESTQTQRVTTRDYNMTCQVHMRMPCAIADVTATSHAFVQKTVDGGEEATVRLDMSGAPKDVSLLVHKSVPHQSALWVQDMAGTATAESTEEGKSATADNDEEEGADKNKKVAMVSWYPHLDEDEFMNDQSAEIIFVVDRSGSMRGGGKLQAAQRTLAICVGSLPEGTMFNVVGFGTRQEWNYPQSVALDDRTKKSTMDRAQRMSANLGGTDLMMPLKSAFNKPPQAGKPRQIFVITDGAVRNTDEVVKLVQQQHVSRGVRFFSFGIGSGASQALVEGIATAGGGAYEMIPDASDVESKVMRQLGRALSPAVVQVSIDWGLTAADGSTEVEVDTIPSAMASKPVFQGDRMLAFAYLSQDASFTSDVVVRGSTPDGEVQERVWEAGASSIETRTAPARMLRACAAKALLDELAVKHAMAELAGQTAECRAIKKRAVRVSTETGVQCKFTSFVAVEERDGAVTGEMRRVEMLQGMPEKQKADAAHAALGGVSASNSRTGRMRGASRAMFKSAGAMPAGARERRRSKSKKQKDSGIRQMELEESTATEMQPNEALAELETRGRAEREVQDDEDEHLHSGLAVLDDSLHSSVDAWGDGGSGPSGSAEMAMDMPPPPPSAQPLYGSAMAPAAAAAAAAAAPVPAARPKPRPAAGGGGRSGGGGGGGGGHGATSSSWREHGQSATSGGSSATSSAILNLVQLQSAAGSWTMDQLAQVATVVFVSRAKITQALAAAQSAGTVADDLAEDVWVTAVVLACLEARMADTADQWLLAAKKAKKWIARSVGSMNAGRSVCEAATAFVGGEAA